MNLPPLAPRHQTPVRKCETCAFFVQTDDEVGQCHRNSPRPAMHCQTDDMTSEIIVWPEVYLNDFCGEWSAT